MTCGCRGGVQPERAFVPPFPQIRNASETLFQPLNQKALQARAAYADVSGRVGGGHCRSAARPSCLTLTLVPPSPPQHAHTLSYHTFTTRQLKKKAQVSPATEIQAAAFQNRTADPKLLAVQTLNDVYTYKKAKVGGLKSS